MRGCYHLSEVLKFFTIDDFFYSLNRYVVEFGELLEAPTIEVLLQYI